MKTKLSIVGFILSLPLLILAKYPIIPYPLTYCIISGVHLDATTAPVTIHYKNQELKFCCKECVKKYYESPESFLKKLQGISR